MRKIILMLLFATMSGGVMAELVHIGQGDGKNLYANAATIRKRGDVVTMEDVLDYAEVTTLHGYKFSSAISHQEYDCKKKRLRMVYLSLRSGGMGSGTTVTSYKSRSNWIPVVPRDFLEEMWKFACSNQ